MVAAMQAIPHAQMDGAMKLPMSSEGDVAPMRNAYEARVLQGIWAAALIFLKTL